MAKALTAYGGWSASEIKSRAGIPAPVDMSVVDDTVECSDVVLSEINAVLGSSENDLSALCSSNLVNIWSCLVQQNGLWMFTIWLIASKHLIK